MKQGRLHFQIANQLETEHCNENLVGEMGNLSVSNMDQNFQQGGGAKMIKHATFVRHFAKIFSDKT